MNLSPIRKLVKKTRQHDPRELDRDSIVYIDISSIDRQTKRIVEPQILLVDEAPSRARKQVYADDVLISTVRPNLNAVALVPPEFHDEIASTGFCVLRTKKDAIDPRYLFYFAQTNAFVSRLTRLSIGAGYPAVSDDTILDTEIPLPPLPEQKRIATILAKADRLRGLRHFARELSDGYLQSVFLEMFGDPVSNPRGWEKTKLSSLCQIIRGASPRPIKDFLGGTVPWIKIGDGTQGDDLYITSTKDHIIEEGVSKSVFLRSGSLIFANCGVSLGFARILKIDGCIHDGWLAFNEVDETRIHPIFLLKTLNQITLYLRSLAPTGTQPNLNTGIMKLLPVILPPLFLQQQFAHIVYRFKRLRGQQREAERQGEYLFQTLLDRAFGGELGPQNPNDEATRKEPGGAERRGSQRPRQLELL